MQKKEVVNEKCMIHRNKMHRILSQTQTNKQRKRLNCFEKKIRNLHSHLLQDCVVVIDFEGHAEIEHDVSTVTRHVTLDDS